MTDVFVDALLDAVKDTLYLIPFLLIVYLAMEWLEHKAGERTQESITRAGAGGPFVGALLGVVPQCGFSAAAATLYAGRVVTLGTLFAVFLATSDEMLPIFIAEQVPMNVILKVLGAKVIIGMVMGALVDAVLRLLRRDQTKLAIHELCERDHCECNGDCHACQQRPELAYGFEEDEDHDHDHGGAKILKSAVKHTVQVTVFIFVVSLVLDLVLAVVGEDVLAQFVAQNAGASVFVTALVGLVPNCAASVAIAELYLDGVLGAGAMMSGLLVSAGIGLLVLFRSNRHLKENLFVLVALYAMGVFWGLVISGLGITF
ncbi:MAG: putative manganese transporter [Coriobacteriia bacterium]|nr:putative manganese transporter [Coriobacteriia bacterium]